MKRLYIPFIAFLVFMCLTALLSFDFIVPGWHTVIYPSTFFATIIIIIVLLFIILAYWLLSKKIGKINLKVFLIHFLLTVPAAIFIRFPFLNIFLRNNNDYDLLKGMQLTGTLIYLSYLLFVAGQVLFIIYFIRNIHSKSA